MKASLLKSSLPNNKLSYVALLETVTFPEVISEYAQAL